MNIEPRDLIAICSILIAVVSMLVVSRNAKKAHAVQLQNTDLTRIRDLRAELKEVRDELRGVSAEAANMRRQMTQTNEFANELLRERMEMIRYAQMPGVTITDWLERYGDKDYPRLIGGTGH